MSDEFIRQKAVRAGSLESQLSHSQRDIFHTVMGAFSMHSDAYVADYDIFSKTFAVNRLEAAPVHAPNPMRQQTIDGTSNRLSTRILMTAMHL
jgi:hypothetical protein